MNVDSTNEPSTGDNTSQETPVLDPAFLQAVADLEGRGDTLSLRRLAADMRASPNRIAPKLRRLREIRDGKTRLSTDIVPGPKPTALDLNPALIEAIRSHLTKSAREVSASLEAQLKAAEDNASLLVDCCQDLETQLTATQAELDLARGVARQQAGQLEERMRELDTVRQETSRAFAELKSTCDGERQVAEELRQQLVRATLRLEAVPRLEASVDEHRELLAKASDALAQARQEAAVAVAQAAAHQDRADEAAQREAALRRDNSEIQAELARAWEGERTLRIEVQQLARAAAIAEGRCALLEAQPMKGNVHADQNRSEGALAQI